MRQAGRYLPEYREVKSQHDFFTICRTPSLACEVTLQPIRRYSGLLDASIIFCDILVIPQAMGMTVEMLDKTGPHFPEPIRTEEKALELAGKEVDVKKELGYVYEAITLTRKGLNGEVPLIGFAGAPWTLLAYMIEGGGSKVFRFVKEFAFKYREATLKLLDRITTVCIDYLVEQVRAGAQLLQLFDSWAGELGQRDFKVYSLPFLTRIATEVKQKLKDEGLEVVPMTVFAKGAWWAVEELSKTDYDVVGLDWTHDPAVARSEAGGRASLQGNLDPNVLYGGKETITREVTAMIKSFAEGGRGLNGYICNLGHGITQWVDPEDMKFFLEEVHRVGKEVQGQALQK